METVGLLGDVSREQAMASLRSAPLLEDLAEWSQWELVYQPNHGPLKHFIDNYCSKSTQLHELKTFNTRLCSFVTVFLYLKSYNLSEIA